MAAWAPADVTELVRTVFYGIAAVCVPLATAYIMIGAARSKRAEDASLRNAASLRTVSTDVARLEKNTNSISERNQAIAMKLGITEGIAQERASVLANAPIVPATLPLPVTDEKVAAGLDSVVEAIKDNANGTSGLSKKT